MITIFKKYSKYLVFLLVSILMFAVQVRAQFGEGDEPPDFDPPPDNDVPLDTYQWVMMALAIGYGIYVFMKHRKQNKQPGKIGAFLPA